MNILRGVRVIGVFALGLALGVSLMMILGGSRDAAISDTTAALCGSHGIPENLCTRCNPELIPEFKVRGDWCDEHDLPESQCDLCGSASAAHADHDADDHSSAQNHREHVSSSVIPETGEDASISVFFPPNKSGCPTDGTVIQLASVQTAARAGLTIEPVITAPLAPTIEAPAEVVFDDTHTRAVTTTVPALVVRWLVEPGELVKTGQPLAEVESPEMPTLEADYVEAWAVSHAQQQEKARKEQLFRQEIISAGDYQSSVVAAQTAIARLTRAEGLLRAAGISDDELLALQTQPAIDAHFALRSPADGVVVRREAKPGDLLAAGTAMALVSSPEFFWVEARVGERDLSSVQVGHELEFLADGSGLTRVAGRVAWVSHFLDPITRTGTVRAQISSPSTQVRPGEFGRALIRSGAEAQTVLVPRDAVQWEGCCNIVFVEETPDRFRPRKVRAEPGDNHHYRIAEGLRAGERIVVQGSFLLKTELKKGSLGVGCAGHDAES